MNSKTVDICVGLALCLFSVLVFWYADRYAGRGVNSYGPDFFPKALAVMMMLGSLGLIGRAALGFSQVRLETTDRNGALRTATALCLAIGYLLIMQVVGFYFASVLFLYVLMLVLGQKGQITRILVSIIVASLIFGAFHFFLKIPLPEGAIISRFRSF